jgi:hypothetical protein
LNELDPARQAQYLATLRRYHNWLNQLPEMKQGELKDKPPGERMELVKKLVADHPVEPSSTTRFLQFVDAGDHSPFELAAIYQIWQRLSPDERKKIEKAPPESRRGSLLKIGATRKMAGEVQPADFDEEKWITAFQTWVRTHRPALLTMFENNPDYAAIRRRQAINYHFLELKTPIKPVTTERLAVFLASFPPWLQF